MWKSRLWRCFFFSSLLYEIRIPHHHHQQHVETETLNPSCVDSWDGKSKSEKKKKRVDTWIREDAKVMTVVWIIFYAFLLEHITSHSRFHCSAPLAKVVQKREKKLHAKCVFMKITYDEHISIAAAISSSFLLSLKVEVSHIYPMSERPECSRILRSTLRWLSNCCAMISPTCALLPIQLWTLHHFESLYSVFHIFTSLSVYFSTNGISIGEHQRNKQLELRRRLRLELAFERH